MRCFYRREVCVNGKEGKWEKKAPSRTGSKSLVLPCYIRFIKVVASKQFLIDVLTKDFVAELDKKCVVDEDEPQVNVNYILHPICSNIDNAHRYSILAGTALPERVSVGIRIHQWSSGTGSNLFIFLRLVWNTQADEIEKVELCGKVIVNQPVLYVESGMVIFEKK